LIWVTAMTFTAGAYARADAKRKQPAACRGRGARLPGAHQPVVYQYAEVAHQQQSCGEHR
jgi:hypothetical protein